MERGDFSLSGFSFVLKSSGWEGGWVGLPGFFFVFVFLSFAFLGSHLRLMELPRLGVKSEL